MVKFPTVILRQRKPRLRGERNEGPMNFAHRITTGSAYCTLWLSCRAQRSTCFSGRVW